ncbi:MAG: hypothetical protein P8165_08050 [Deltaproteobacteria bacterium]
MDRKDVGEQIDEKRLVSYLETGISAEDMCRELGVKMTTLQEAVNDVCAKNPNLTKPEGLV